jgi:hypothetical protein
MVGINTIGSPQAWQTDAVAPKPVMQEKVLNPKKVLKRERNEHLEHLLDPPYVKVLIFFFF